MTITLASEPGVRCALRSPAPNVTCAAGLQSSMEPSRRSPCASATNVSLCQRQIQTSRWSRKRCSVSGVSTSLRRTLTREVYLARGPTTMNGYEWRLVSLWSRTRPHHRRGTPVSCFSAATDLQERQKNKLENEAMVSM